MLSEEFSAVHLIGIGGTGLSAIARLLMESGCKVSGSDQMLSPLARSLQEAGVAVYQGHRAENIQGAKLVIRSSAIRDDNVEVQAALAAGIPVLKRSEFLGRLMENRIGIAIAGTHGKTTTTAMAAWMLTVMNQDPSYIIGGVSVNLGNNAHAGKGSFFVIEADEYDRMFLGLHPKVAIVTNIEHDHPDCYPTEEQFYQAFHDFAHGLDSRDWLVACVDDRGASRLAEQVHLEGYQVLTYGSGPSRADYMAQSIKPNARGGFSFTAVYQGNSIGKVNLRVPGLHNVNNALAVLVIAHQMELPMALARQSLSDFEGTGRRFEVRGVVDGVIVIDDYAHHPTEIRATLSAARSRYPKKRIWAVWQPHTYSRTQGLFDAFVKAFDDADRVIVTEVYAAREASQIGTFSARQVVEAMANEKVVFIPLNAQVVEFLLDNLRPDDVMIVMSAGDADQISTQVLKALAERKGLHV
jgi:UDP-N-acetylmuramate--alanine ligase